MSETRKVLCRFTVQSVTIHGETKQEWVDQSPANYPFGAGKYGAVTLAPVYSNDPASPNRIFWSATPSGRMEMQINNPSAFGAFLRALGQEVDIEMTLPAFP